MIRKYIVLGAIFLASVLLTGCTQNAPADTSADVQGEAVSESSVTWCITEPEAEEFCYDPISFNPGDSAYTSLVALDEREETFSFDGTDYGDAGFFVTSINGIEGNTEYFWKLFQNDSETMSGISQIILNDKDTMSFEYTEIQF